MFANTDKIGFGVFFFAILETSSKNFNFFETGLLEHSQIFGRIPTLAPRFAKNIANSKSLLEVLLEGKNSGCLLALKKINVLWLFPKTF